MKVANDSRREKIRWLLTCEAAVVIIIQTTLKQITVGID